MNRGVESVPNVRVRECQLYLLKYENIKKKKKISHFIRFSQAAYLDWKVIKISLCSSRE